MAEIIKLQDLNQRFPITDPETGQPSDYFMRYLFERQGFLIEVDTDLVDLANQIALKADKSTQIIAGAGLTGGGDLSADRTLSADEQAILDAIGSTRGSVLYRGASGWAILAPGTNGHVLTSNGAGADPSYQAAGGGGGGPTVDTYSPSGAATVDIDLSAVTGNAIIEYFLEPATDNVALWGRVTDDGFTTVKSGGSDYSYFDYRQGTGGTATSSSNSDSKMIMQNPIGNNTNEYASGSFTVYQPGNSSFVTTIQGQGNRQNPSGQQNMDNFVGTYQTASVVDGIQLLMQSGNLTGEVTCTYV